MSESQTPRRVTTIGESPPSTLTATATLPAVLPTANISTVPSAGAINLDEAQFALAKQQVQALNFLDIPTGSIIQIGFQEEQALQATLDGFLSRLNTKNAGELFDLFGQLQKGVSDTDLPGLLQQIQSTKPGVLRGALNRVMRKSPEDIAREAYQVVCDLIAGKTKTLTDLMKGLENELQEKMRALLRELTQLDALKKEYRNHWQAFAVVAVASRMFLDQAREIVVEERRKLQADPDVRQQTLVQELESKLQLLESRALALEGSCTRLPADELVIQNIEQAGVATLQETATTSSQRFANIKMTLLALHGAVQIKGVQQLSASHASLDAQLATVRGAVMKEVVTTAANAPGDNRLAQAVQIEAIIRETTDLQTIVATARTENQRKFGEAHQRFAAARAALAHLS